jgi:UPF0176 protein
MTATATIQSPRVAIAAFYRFVAIAEPAELASEICAIGSEGAVKGTIIVAHEGFNGTIAGEPAAVEAVLDRLRAVPNAGDFRVMRHQSGAVPFMRWKVKVKREIVTMGHGDLDPARNAGTHVAPADWNALIAQDDVVLIDTRNAYEVGIGSFENALDPGTRAFGEFPAWFDAKAEQWQAEGRTPRIAMFCTGGIRCEKSTAYARSRGFEEVYHLKGGILAYLDEVPEADSRWNGNCFIFDERVSLDHSLDAATVPLCPTCGQPVSAGAEACADHRSAAGEAPSA